MPEVNVEINGRKYRMACEEGQEPHLIGLADRFNRSIDNLKNAFGEIGDNRLTVMAGIAAIAAAGDLVHDVVAAACRVVAAKREIAAGAGGSRRHLVRQRLYHGRENRLGDALRHFGGAARNGARIMRIEECSLGTNDLEGLESAGGDRHVGVDVAHGEIDGGQRRRQNRIHRPHAGLRRTAEIEGEFAVTSGHRKVDGQWLVDHAIAIDIGDRAVGALGDQPDIGAHLLGGAAAELGNRLRDGVVAVAVEQPR